jgi:hypothetical protein
VDDTLVIWTGGQEDFEPGSGKIAISNPVGFIGGKVVKTEIFYLTSHDKHIQKLKGYKRSGYYVIVWSMGGGEWAKSVVEALQLKDHVDFVTGKPLYLYDDLPLNEAFGTRKYYDSKKKTRIEDFKTRIEIEPDVCQALYDYATIRLLAHKYAYYKLSQEIIKDAGYDHEEQSWYVMGRALGVLKEDETSPCIDFDENHPLASEGQKLAELLLKRKV